MRKIPTIFDRDWGGNCGVIDKYTGDYDFDNAIATEKLDGTNIRLTFENGEVVKVEKRRNPNKKQKAEGVEPWYVDTSPDDPADKWILEAAQTVFPFIYEIVLPDGQYPAEAVGPKIQGNPLQLEKHYAVPFTAPAAEKLLTIPDAPTTYNELREWLPEQQSRVGYACGIEGIVWHWPDGSMAKIKCKDFR